MNMTNQEYIEIEKIIDKVVRKYNTHLIDHEDMKQICIEFILKYGNYDINKNMKYETYIYQLCKWAINKELDKQDSINTFISIYEPIGDDLTMSDTLEDININIERETTDKLIINAYYDEIQEKLQQDRARVLTLRAFDGKSYKELEKITGFGNYKVKETLIQARRELLKKSIWIRKEYEKYTGITSCNNTEVLALSKI